MQDIWNEEQKEAINLKKRLIKLLKRYLGFLLEIKVNAAVFPLPGRKSMGLFCGNKDQNSNWFDKIFISKLTKIISFGIEAETAPSNESTIVIDGLKNSKKNQKNGFKIQTKSHPFIWMIICKLSYIYNQMCHNNVPGLFVLLFQNIYLQSPSAFFC